MKKLLALSVLLNLAFVVGLGLSWKALTAHAAGGGGGGTPVGNGDANGDGTINLSDAVYTLSWLFMGGPAPAAIECPPAAGRGLPATGQTKCYGVVDDAGWVEMSCDQAACEGQDPSYALGCPSEGRFVDNGDGTVTDNCTGLMWQKDTADMNGSGAIETGVPGDGLPWCALSYCENLSLAGHDDWRLPNVRELQSIVDYGRRSPAIDPVFGAVSDRYWSSSSLAEIPGYAWHVNFYVGLVEASSKGDLGYVRAVRGGS